MRDPTACPDDPDALLQLKSDMGFSDARLAEILAGRKKDQVKAQRACETGRPPGLQAHRHLRGRVRAARPPICIPPTRRETDAGSTRPSRPTREKVIILGGGPNRIGQGIEFDYCCVHACFALAEAGYETIMVNCNPETVSTDYDTSDRLYFEPLTAEDVIEHGARRRKARHAARA